MCTAETCLVHLSSVCIFQSVIQHFITRVHNRQHFNPLKHCCTFGYTVHTVFSFGVRDQTEMKIWCVKGIKYLHVKKTVIWLWLM